ncbi:FAD-dependent oxidoreductase [Patescibacteria group bacterium]|nr:FAD-dependent oxidoreductase [Patescibacteria group bacterium]
MKENIYDIIIIGGGPAGITAGIYVTRQRMKTLLITKEYGGQMGKKATEVCNYPGFGKIGGQKLIKKFVDHLDVQEFIEKKFAEVGKIEKDKENFIVITTEKEKIYAKSVIIATGADPRPLEVPGEKEFIGRGLSYCVTCDGPVFKNKDIVVIGGGNAGFEAAIFMVNYADNIYILECGLKAMADAENQEEAKKFGKIEIITNAEVKEIKGDKIVNALVYEDLATKKIKTLDIQGVFVEIGSQPATALAKGLVDFNERDEIKVEFETFQTKTSGLFAVGDVNVGKYKQIVTAAGEGCKAALAAYEYVHKQKI